MAAVRLMDLCPLSFGSGLENGVSSSVVHFGHRTSLVPKSFRYHGPVNFILSGKKEILVCLVLCVQMGLSSRFPDPSFTRRESKVQYQVLGSDIGLIIVTCLSFNVNYTIYIYYACNSFLSLAFVT
ncbi:hypothetical protein FKM82_004648 [Ascaphus truei]